LLKDSDITVDTDARVVTLRGTTGSPPAMLKAAAIARGTRGVERIVNHLGVKTP
jgi:osmotically-inducible protein OsmY